MTGIQQLKGYTDSDFGMGLFTFYREQAEIEGLSHKKEYSAHICKSTEFSQQKGNKETKKTNNRFESIFLSNREKSRLNNQITQKINLINLKKQIIAPFEKIKKKRSKQLRIYNGDEVNDIFENRRKLFKRKFKTDQSFGLNEQVKVEGYSYPSNKLLQLEILSSEQNDNSLPKIKRAQQNAQYINKSNEKVKLSPSSKRKEKERKRRFLTQENSKSIQNIKKLVSEIKQENFGEKQQNKREKSFSNFVMISEKHYQLLAKSGLRKEVPLISIFKKYSRSN